VDEVLVPDYILPFHKRTLTDMQTNCSSFQALVSLSTLKTRVDQVAGPSSGSDVDIPEMDDVIILAFLQRPSLLTMDLIQNVIIWKGQMKSYLTLEDILSQNLQRHILHTSLLMFSMKLTKSVGQYQRSTPTMMLLQLHLVTPYL
jgi:hypothetical protein